MHKFEIVTSDIRHSAVVNICDSCGLNQAGKNQNCLCWGARDQMPKNNIFRLGFLTRLFHDLKLLIPLIGDYWKGRYRDLSAKSMVIFVVALAYIISPIDLIPDYIIGLGQIDDAAILGIALYFLEKDLRKYKEWKDMNG